MICSVRRAICSSAGRVLSFSKVAHVCDIDCMALVHLEVRVVQEGLYVEILATNHPQPQNLDIDVLWESAGLTTVLVRPRIDSTSTHGTGCTVSAALTCAIAGGATVLQAAISATAYTHLGLYTASKIDAGHGPLNHLHSVSEMGIPSCVG
ncbi:hypothetical protein C8R44DRAFT_796058 [Mycena epipterygia]|nr:hypothetical protein C8R44DRAFT_796058 [Mycena epipterygia]